MLRRDFLLKSAATMAVGAAAKPIMGAPKISMPVVDAHIHLFDPTRPGGVPWPEKTDAALYMPALPPRYAHLAEPHGVVGAIAVECSSWMLDNFWLHDVVERNFIMLGYIGDLLPAETSFGATLEWLHRSPLFLGIRYGNLWNRNLLADVQKPEFVAGLKLLAQTGLVLETANPNTELIAAVLQVSERVPDLRIVIDHLPHAEIPSDVSARGVYEKQLKDLAGRPHIFVKGSEILKKVDGKVSFDIGSYKASLDALWDLFGEDRIFFGSDWPNSDSVADYDRTFAIAQQYIETRSKSAQEKYFWKNSIAVYRWKGRTEAQRRLLAERG
jgi:predicted TIM-barrel fold metal-dependent hydrolase